VNTITNTIVLDTVYTSQKWSHHAQQEVDRY